MALAGRRGLSGRSPRVLARSDHLVLTPLVLHDRDEYVTSLLDPEVREWQGFDDACVEVMVRDFDAHLLAHFRRRPTMLAIREAPSGPLVAHYAITPNLADPLADTVSLGWWTLAQHRGKGQSREALRLVLRWLHDEAGIGTVLIGTRSDNKRVLAQIQGSGARELHELPTPLPNGTTPLGKWFVHEAGSDPQPP